MIDIKNINDYDSFVPGFEQIVPAPEAPCDSFEEEVVPHPTQAPTLKCPFCSGTGVFNPESISKVANFNCHTCKSNVPSNTVMKLANDSYVSSLEILAEDPQFIDNLKGSLRVVKDYGEESEEKKS